MSDIVLTLLIVGIVILILVCLDLQNRLEKARSASEEWRQAAQRNAQKSERYKIEADEAKRIIRKISLGDK